MVSWIFNGLQVRKKVGKHKVLVKQKRRRKMSELGQVSPLPELATFAGTTRRRLFPSGITNPQTGNVSFPRSSSNLPVLRSSRNTCTISEGVCVDDLGVQIVFPSLNATYILAVPEHTGARSCSPAALP